jgi:outer membrane beta-barrel protein
LALLAGPGGVIAEPLSGGLHSEPVIQPEIERREVREVEIDDEDFEIGLYVGFLSIEDFGTDRVLGARLAYHVTEGLFMEAAYGRSEAGETSFESLSGSTKLLSDEDRNYTYYNLSLGYNLFPGQVYISDSRTFSSQFYLIAGIGNTSFAGSDEYTVNVGAGYRLLLTDWLALHLDARDHMFKSDLLGEEKTTHNLEYSTGLTLFF